MGFRPGKTKGPWVGKPGEATTASSLGGGCPIFAGEVGDDLQFKSLDAVDPLSITCGPDMITISDLTTHSSIGGGCPVYAGDVGNDVQFKSLDVVDPLSISCGVDMITITLDTTSIVDEKVAVSANDTTPGYLIEKIAAELGLDDNIRNPSGDEILEIDNMPGYSDDFTDSELRPFWQNTDPIVSGDWQLDNVNDVLEGIAENNTFDIFRYGIEGDFDYAMKIDRNSASSCGFYFFGYGLTLRFSFQSFQYIIECTGQTTQNPANSDDLQWLRVKKHGTTVYFYRKINDTDSWDLLHTYTGILFGYHITAALDSANTAEIHEVDFHDNSFPKMVRGDAPKVVTLEDAATINVDAARGNLFTVTLAGNRQLNNPTNPVDGQKIMFRIHQDGTGNRTLSYDTKYNFSTDLPSPTLSTAASAYDYLGFVYNKVADTWDYIAEVKGF